MTAALSTWSASPAAAQYFGQNKVQYESFDFKVLKTAHFDLYYYPEEEASAREAARMAERWYARLASVLDHQLSSRQPLVLYASHPHFEQTNIIEGTLGEGTGGVTEGLKRRIVMPVGGGPAETDHVLGHELVHAFQYDILGPAINLPLWFIEGMAEYLSIGSHDPQTAVWLRDAALNEKLPALKDLDKPEYFPYRFGHAFWAYVGGRYGDRRVADILHTAAGPQSGPNARTAADPIAVIEDVLGIDDAQLSSEWHTAVLASMLRPLGDRARVVGPRIIEPDDEHELNVGPVLSPDGTRLAFLSSRDRLSIDLFIADAATGRIQRKLISTAADPHFDSLQFIASAGAWDPTGRLFAVGAIRRGRPVIAIFDVDSGDRRREIELPGVDEVFNPAWSPDGRVIAFSGLAGGFSDLWVLEMESGTVRKLTDDAFADLQPSWSPDGRRLVFVTDRFSTSLERLEYGAYELAIVEVGSGETQRLQAFARVRHNSPQWVADGGIFFIAYPEGIPDVFRVPAGGGTPVRVTRLITGATAITPTSPALAVASNGSRVAVVVYRNSTYEIQGIERAALSVGESAPAVSAVDAGQLAPAQRQDQRVDALIARATTGLPQEAAATVEPYKPGLSLTYIGQEFGVTTNSLGGNVGGGIAFALSDMLGEHLVTSVVQVNGGLDQFGGQIGYLNRQHRWNWGAFLEQIPYVTGGVIGGPETLNGQAVFTEQLVRDRQVDRRLGGLTQYPLSRATRLELAGAIRHLTFDRRIDTRSYSLASGDVVFDDTERASLGEPLTLGEFTTALVRDTSVFGVTGPILGHRSRLELSPVFGDLRFTRVTADVRHYVMPFRPVTIAARVLHVGRYGSDAESLRLSPLYVGFSGLVRGYDINTFDVDDCQIGLTGGCPAVDNLIGSRLLVAGAEVRAPLVGLFRGRLEYGRIPAELVGFFDAGVAWDSNSRPSGFGSGDRPWARSYGGGVRVNAFGFAILEFMAARPVARVDNSWRFVFGIRPGF